MPSLGINSLPAERLRGCKFAENFKNQSLTVANGATLTGSPVFTVNGINFNGTTQYAYYNLAGSEFNSASISIVVSFIPDFAANEDATRVLFDSSATKRYLLFKYNNSGNNILQIQLGNTSLSAIPYATYSPYWLVGQSNTIVISGTSGSNNVWLNGVQIVTNGTTAWAAKTPVEFDVGCDYTGANKFKGSISKIQVYQNVLTAQEALDICNGVTFTYTDDMSLDLPCSTGRHDASNNRCKDISVNRSHATLGDGSTASTFPAKYSDQRGYLFDGSNDYFSGLITPTGSYTVSICKRVAGTVSITHENDLTTWNKITTGGQFTGDLLGMRVHPRVLTTLQQYNEQFILMDRLNQNDLPQGFLAKSVAEGSCVLYQDYRSGSFMDLSAQPHSCTPSEYTTWNSNGLSCSLGVMVVTNTARLQTTEGCMVFLSDFTTMATDQYLFEKAYQNDLWASSAGTVLTFSDGVAARSCSLSVADKKCIAVNYKSGEIAEAFADGLSVGLFSGTSTITTNTNNINIWNGGDLTKGLLANAKAVLIFNRKLSADEHARLYEELNANSWEDDLYTKSQIDVSDFVDTKDSSLLAAYGSSPVQNTLLNLKSSAYPITLKGQTKKVGWLGGMVNQTTGNWVNAGITTAILNPITQNHTVSAWVRVPVVPASTVVLMGKGIPTGYGAALNGGIQIQPVAPGFRIGYQHYTTSTQVYGGTTNYPINQWLHICYSTNHTTGLVSLYINGALTASGSSVGMLVDGSMSALGFRFFGIGGTLINLYDVAQVEMNFFQVHNQAKDAAWVLSQYNRGLTAFARLGYGAQESIANDTSGALSNTQFQIASGTWRITDEVIESKHCKVITCVADGIVYLSTSVLN
jgi:hypothetical protein